MNRCKFALTMSGSLVLGLAGVVNADDASQAAQIERLNARVAELEGRQNNGLLDQRRAEEIKGLIQEVLSDADTRASLMADGAVAGHDGTSFFLSSVDGSQRLNIWGQIQFRYLFNFENANDDDEEDEGFQTRRTKLGFNGHVTAGRIWDYEVIIALDRGDGNTFFEDVKFGTELADNLRIDAGKFKLPFQREELISSKRQLTVERSGVNEFFTLNRAEQVQLSWKSDMVKLAVAVSDGANSEFSDIGADAAEFAITGRVDVKLQGEWTQAGDTSAWSNQPVGIFLGAAAHWELGDGNNGGSADYLAWTVDGSFESGGLGIFAAVSGGHTDNDPGTGVADRDMLGIVVQISYNINDTIEPFIRGEWLDDDIAADQAIIITAGFNYYISKSHDAKFTLDVLWFMDGDVVTANPFGTPTSGFDSGTGFSVGDVHEEDNFLIRAQFQLLF